MSIYTIQEEYLKLIQELEEAEGELTPELSDALAINKEELKQKAQAYCYIIQMRKGDNLTLQSEIERLNGLKAMNERVIKKLTTTLVEAMMLMPDKVDTTKTGKIWRLELPYFKLSTRRSESVEIVNPLEIEDKYKYFSVEKLDKKQYDDIILLINPNKEIEVKSSVEISKTLIGNDLEREIDVKGAGKKTSYGLNLK